MRLDWRLVEVITFETAFTTVFITAAMSHGVGSCGDIPTNEKKAQRTKEESETNGKKVQRAKEEWVN